MKDILKDIEILSAKARTFLGTAEQTLSTGDYDSCASRCYYAMFLMAEAARDFVRTVTDYLDGWAEQK